MDKKELRAVIRAQKRAMTNAQIDACSEKLAALFRAHPLYQQAKSIYGYLPYNQEVRTVPMLRQAQLDGKRVAVPKVYGDTMKFLWLDDLNAVAPGAYNIPEPIADGPEADDETALVLMPGLAFDPEGHRCATAAGSMISSSPRTRRTRRLRCATAFRCSTIWKRMTTIFRSMR